MNLIKTFSTSINTADKELLNNIIDSSIESAKRIINIPLPYIKVIEDVNSVIPQFGVSGYCGNKQTIVLYIESGRQAGWQKYLPETIYHEWHHLARWHGPGYGETLINVIISEGLAQHFEAEVDNTPPAFYSSILNDTQRTEALEILKKEYVNPTYHHRRWFFGAGEMPFLAGYDISYYLTGMYLNEFKLKPSELVNLSNETFIEFLKQKSLI